MNRDGWNLPMHPMRTAIPRTAVPHFLITAMAETCSKRRGGERDERSHCVASERTKVKGERGCEWSGVEVLAVWLLAFVLLLFHAKSARVPNSVLARQACIARP